MIRVSRTGGQGPVRSASRGHSAATSCGWGARGCSDSAWASMLQLQAASARETGSRVGGPGWGKAKSIIMLYFQGGPSPHRTSGTPRTTSPENVPQRLQDDRHESAGDQLQPRCSRSSRRAVDKDDPDPFDELYAPTGCSITRPPIYQMMTGYTTDKVSPSGQLEPPRPEGLSPTSASNIIRLKPPTEPMLPFVMLPRAAPGVERRGARPAPPASSGRRTTRIRSTPERGRPRHDQDGQDQGR